MVHFKGEESEAYRLRQGHVISKWQSQGLTSKAPMEVITSTYKSETLLSVSSSKQGPLFTYCQALETCRVGSTMCMSMEGASLQGIGVLGLESVPLGCG